MTIVPRLIKYFEQLSLGDTCITGTSTLSGDSKGSAAVPFQSCGAEVGHERPGEKRPQGRNPESVESECGEGALHFLECSTLVGECVTTAQVRRYTKTNTLFSSRDVFWDFPYRGAGQFRERLLSKRATQDTDWVMSEVLARLGPQECSFERKVVESKFTDADAFDLAFYENEDYEVLGESSELLHGSHNPYAVLQDMPEEGCTMANRLGGKARRLVRWFSDLGFTKTGHLPSLITCGGLRPAVRHCFSDIDPVGELSFRTVQKLEKSCCKRCLPQFEEKLVEWKTARVRPVEVDSEHLSRFATCLALNIEKGWDSRRRLFIPNGNATRQFRRKDGGNWNVEEFSDECRTELVFSSGKPRVVTLYSAENTRILAPLHYSLYDSLRRRGWLLVGDPTDEHVQSLTGADMLSFDYSSATDNIKSVYVRTAIEELKKKADHLSQEEARAMDVLARLNLGDCVAETGQPMGSVMSFPLLCLINKTVVDMALVRLFERKEISFNEWSGHRLLVNGDDLLTREPRSNTNLRSAVSEEGAQVGLVVNHEKTMVSPTDGEINSTYFKNGHRVRKFNAAAIWMDAGTEDVLGFAQDSSVDGKTFRKLVRSNLHILAKQPDKQLDRIRPVLQGVCRKDKKIRRALTSLPETVRTIEKGVIVMAQRPEDYDLSRDEEQDAMRLEIERVRERGIARATLRKPKFYTRAIPNAKSFTSLLKMKRDVKQELIPSCFLRAFTQKHKDALVEEDLVNSSPGDLLPPGDGSRVSIILDNLRLFKLQKKTVASPGTLAAQADYVRFD